jgi:hypothetical protein
MLALGTRSAEVGTMMCRAKPIALEVHVEPEGDALVETSWAKRDVLPTRDPVVLGAAGWHPP